MTSRNLSGVGLLLGQLGSFAGQQMPDALSPLGLTPAEATMLRTVALRAASAPLSQRELAERAGLAPSRVVVLLDALEARGLLVRERVAGDRRRHQLRPTERGLETLQRVRELVTRMEADLLAPLGESDRERLAALLRTVAQAHGLPETMH